MSLSIRHYLEQRRKQRRKQRKKQLLPYTRRIFFWGNPCEQGKHVCGLWAGSALLGDVHVAAPGTKGCRGMGRGG